jgi:hypothetical protein
MNLDDFRARQQERDRDRTRAEKELREIGPDGRRSWEPTYGWSSTDPVRLASALEVIRRRLCAYGGMSPTCDCKFGIGVTLLGAQALSGSEATGCPELRSVIQMLLHPNEIEILPSESLRTEGP